MLSLVLSLIVRGTAKDMGLFNNAPLDGAQIGYESKTLLPLTPGMLVVRNKKITSHSIRSNHVIVPWSCDGAGILGVNLDSPVPSVVIR